MNTRCILEATHSETGHSFQYEATLEHASRAALAGVGYSTRVVALEGTESRKVRAFGGVYECDCPCWVES